MKKFIRTFAALLVCAAVFTACSEDTPSAPEVPGPAGEVEDPVDEGQKENTWVLDDGEELKMGSMMIFESEGQITALFSAREGLKSPLDFDEADDCTGITFPVSAVGSEIDLTKLTGDDNTCVTSRLPEFGESGLTIGVGHTTISSGTLTSELENGEISVKCEFTTLGTDIKCSIYMRGQLRVYEPAEHEGSYYEYSVKSSDIAKSGELKRGFYLRDTWDDGWTFTYSVSAINSYIQLGNSTFIEISIGTDELLDGQPFDVATTQYPFSFKLEYLDMSQGDLVPVTIDNEHRAGASGHITMKQNSRGLYDAEFDLTLESGNVTVSGYFADALQPRNTVYDGTDGPVAVLRSATLDISGDPCVLYLSSDKNAAGKDNYDIKCEVPAAEWQYGKFMAFSGQDSSVTWTDGVCYNSDSSKTTSIFGGNWIVYEPSPLADDSYLAECTTMLFGSPSCYAYYYGKIKIVE